MKKNIILFCLIFVFLGCSEDASTDGTSFTETGQGGSLARFALFLDYLYVVDDSNLNVFSITDLENPVQINTVPIGFDIETLFVYKTYLYIGSRNGMFIYDVQNPEEPTYLSDVQHFTACDPVVANATHAYVTLHTNIGCGTDVNRLEIYDVTNVTDPILISFRNLTQPIGIGLYGDYLFVCDDEVKVFDVSDLENSQLVTSIDINAFDVIINSGILVLIGDNGLHQFSLDDTNINNIEFLSSLSI